MEAQVDRCDECHLVARVKKYRVAAAPRQPGFLQTPSRLRPHSVANAEVQLCVRCRWKVLRSDYLWMSAGMVVLVLAGPWLDSDSTRLGPIALVVAIVIFPLYWFSPKARASVQRYLFESRRNEMARQAGLPAKSLLPILDP